MDVQQGVFCIQSSPTQVAFDPDTRPWLLLVVHSVLAGHDEGFKRKPGNYLLRAAPVADKARRASAWMLVEHPGR